MMPALILLDIVILNTFHDDLSGKEFGNYNKLKYINLENYEGKDIFSSIPNNNIIICMHNFDIV